MPFDLVLRGGRVIDPSQKLDAITDVAFAAGKVVMVGNELKVDQGTDVRDVSGYIVTPSLIDLHTHVYWGGTSIGIDAEARRRSRSFGRPEAVSGWRVILKHCRKIRDPLGDR
jgi:predicted amidohydrolase